MNIDIYLFELINNIAGKNIWLDKILVFLASDLQYLVVLAVLVIFVLYMPASWLDKEAMASKKIRRMAWVSLFAAIVARFGVGGIIKRLVNRPRPFANSQIIVHQLLDYSSKYSFPSGHALFFSALATVIFLINKKMGYWFIACAILISLTRIAVGIHYPSDILFGALIGIFIGWLSVKLVFK